jgi:hypothetical protein
MRQWVRFAPVDVPVRAPVTKLGGQPVWLQAPQWPLSASVGEPMTFIGQFRLDEPDQVRVAYLFMTEGYDVDTTWDSEGGENAVIVQPGGEIPSFVTVRELPAGPSWPERDHLPTPEEKPADDALSCDFIGGEPEWLQFAEPPGPDWRFVAQLTDQLGYNFGDAGIGYLFVSPSGSEGRFLWQCG